MLTELIEYTHQNVFLTGKAGTGKTTFLNQFTQKTKKKYVIAAPTGIAAINAGGVTIHSLFSFPLNNFIPTNDVVDANEALNRAQLLPHLHYRSDKRALLCELELLIIDEVSMLRADILDAIDFALRTVRRNAAPFGGVQLLLIGDLHQLPPVVRSGKDTLDQYYASPFFFEAYALKEKPLVTYRLDKIFRQSDENFIHLLNKIRNGEVNDEDLSYLHQRYIPDFEPTEPGYIYLVSHNYLADKINADKLAAISEKSFSYDAFIEGEFRTQLFPNDANLELKVGAQIMFIRNDNSPEKAYFNGKIGTITQLTDKEIFVKCEGNPQPIKVRKEIWENKTYRVDKSTQEIKQEIMGSYEQFPIKLAWAVTIHKCQGLTFEKVIIDAGQAFASGQIYVALSRCTTLNGIVLKSKIAKHLIFSDKRISSFQSDTEINAHVEQLVENERYAYAISKMKHLLNFELLYDEILGWKNVVLQQKKFHTEPIEKLALQSLNAIREWEKTRENFILYLEREFQLFRIQKNNWDQILQKSKNAVAYFIDKLLDTIVLPLIEHIKEVKGQKGLKGYNESVKKVLELCQAKLLQFKNSTLFEHELYLEDPEHEVIAESTKGIQKKKTHEISLEWYQNGKSIEAIAEMRELNYGTIFGHLAKAVVEGILPITDFVNEEKIEVFKQVYTHQKQHTLNEWKEHLPPHFEYHEIRLLLDYFEKKTV